MLPPSYSLLLPLTPSYSLLLPLTPSYSLPPYSGHVTPGSLANISYNQNDGNGKIDAYLNSKLVETQVFPHPIHNIYLFIYLFIFAD